jgi:hypothetical protein
VSTINLITPAKQSGSRPGPRKVNVSLSLDADLAKEGPTGGPLPSQMPGGGSGADRSVVAARPRRERVKAALSLIAVPGLPRRTPGPEPRDAAPYVVDTIAVSYHGNNSTHLDSLAHLYFKGKICNGYPQTS